MRFYKNKGAFIALILLLFIFIAVLIGPHVYTVDPYALDIKAKNQYFSWKHVLGTDNLGRDILAQLLIGGRISLAVGIVSMMISVFIGIIVGICAGYYPKLDGLLMRITDLFLALPLLPLLLLVMMLFRDLLRAFCGPELGVFILIVSVIGITSWMNTARIVRGDVLFIKNREFIIAAISSGVREHRIILKHLLPNIISSIIVSAILSIAEAIITESALSFLGFGFPSDFPTWGRLLHDGTTFFQVYPYRVLYPGCIISLTIFSINYIGMTISNQMDSLNSVH
nr:ABC transporter permease [Liberibacter crescens]